jgi:glycosyltransferase involved in cell wall biosynthesis
MKKVLIISHSLNRSGAPLALLQLIKTKPRKPLEIFLLGLRHDDLKIDFQKYVNECYVIEPHPSKNILIDAFQRLKAIPKIIKHIIRIRPDIILINSAANSRAIIVSKILQRRFNYKIIVYVHEFNYMFRALGSIRIKTVALADKIIVVNPQQLNWLKNEIGIKKDIKVVPNTIDKDDIYKNLIYSEPDEEFLKFRKKFRFLVANIGLMSLRKGYDIYANIIDKMYKHEDVGFVIVGDFIRFKDKEMFLKKIIEKNLLNRIYITGFTDNIFKYLKYVDVIAITSRSETFSRVALESMILGKPIVAFDIIGLRYVFPKNYLYLAKPFDVNDFIGKILEIKNLDVLKLEDLRKELILQADKFTTENISNSFWEEIDEQS